MAITYVFGAGASVHAGYPLASQMGSALLDFMLESENRLIRDSAEFLIETFGSTPNIEDLITESQSEIERLKDSNPFEARVRRSNIGNSMGFLTAALREWFREVHSNAAPGYAAFAEGIVKPGDVVITFNYDDSLERELRRVRKWDISRGYGFQLGTMAETSDVLVLKLHGSINWLVSLFGGATGGEFLVNPISSMGSHPVLHQADLKFLQYENFSGHTYRSGGALPCLILPGRTKAFFYDTSFGHEFADFWDHLWSLAAKALKRSDRIILCGYSLSPVDQRACELLLGVPRKDTPVSVICGDQSERIAADSRRAGFLNVTVPNEKYFSEWCTAQTQESEIVAAIRIGLEEAKAGKTRPAREALEELGRKHGLRRRGNVGPDVG